MLSAGLNGSGPRACLRRSSSYVAGMICIRPIAILTETAHASPWLSARMTARIPFGWDMKATRRLVSRTGDNFRCCPRWTRRALGGLGGARLRIQNRDKGCHRSEYIHRKRKLAATSCGEHANFLWRHSRHSHVQSGTARPINFSEGMVPKQRPLSDEGSSQLKSKTWPTATERRPLQIGRDRPASSRFCTTAMVIPSKVAVRRLRQTRWRVVQRRA